MKKIILLASCISTVIFSASAQNIITANSAIHHIGEQVRIVDNVYSIKVYNDSTAVISLGRKNDKTALNVVFDFDSNFKFDADMLASFKQSKIAISGFVVLVDKKPTIVLTQKQNLRYLSETINQIWLAICQLPNEKELL